MDFNQIYRAPSVPKISRRNVSSSSIRGAAAKPKINKSTFSFVKPANTQKAKVEALSQAGTVGGTLQETNTILIEIQKQLSLDFAMRIAEEKENLKRIRTERSKLKAAEKESAIEAGKKLGSPIGKAFSVVTERTKGIFQRIVDFFQLILTGIVVNQAFKWLLKPGNKEKLFGVVDFVGKYWKELLGVFIGVKVFGFLYKLIRFGRFVGRLFGFGRRGPGGPGGPGGRGPGGGPIGGPMGGCGPTLKCLDKAKSYQLENFANELAKTKKFSPLFATKPPSRQPAAKGGQPWWATALDILSIAGLLAMVLFPEPGTTAAGAAGLAARFGLKQGIKQGVKQGVKRGVKRGVKPTPINMEEMRNLMSQSGLKGLSSGPSIAPRKKSVRVQFPDLPSPATLESATQRGPLQGKLTQQTAQEFINNLVTEASKVKSSKGGPIFGGTSSSVDNIPLLAAKNEYMVSNIKNQATTFRPILDDINYNAGKLWSLFTIAVKRLSSAIIRQKENSDKFKGTIEKFDRTLKERKVAKPGNVGNGGYRSFKKQNVAPVPKVYNVSQIMEDTTPIIRPFNLPTQVVNSQPPEIPTLQNKATGVELIDPINPLNPYMMLVPGILGII